MVVNNEKKNVFAEVFGCVSDIFWTSSFGHHQLSPTIAKAIHDIMNDSELSRKMYSIIPCSIA